MWGMAKAHANGIDLEYVVDGDPMAEPMLLIMGLTAQLTAWPQELVEELARRGFRVIRFDNRDSGLSSKLDGVQADILGMLAGTAQPPYTLADMADDAAGLLDALGLESAHVVGASMGGMIAQRLVIDHPERVRSLCSIMSTTGAPEVGQPSPEATGALLAPAPATREEAIARGMAASRIIGSKTHPASEAELRDRLEAAYDRSSYPEGAVRQLAAIFAGPDRTSALAEVRVPTVVIHGTEDPLVQPDGGRATAAAIPGAELLELEGMGHDLPSPLIEAVATAIEKNARRAGG